MDIQTTFIPGLLVVKPSVYNDNRGCFYEVYSQMRYAKNGIDAHFLQDNLSQSVKGVIRGLHYQLAPYSQAKLVHVLRGRVLDVAVDLRAGSPTFGKHFSIELSESNRLQFYIPSGFAHGFSVLSDEVLFYYKCDNEYHKDGERGINYNDSTFNINWGVSAQEAIVSPKDGALPAFLEAEMNFIYSEKA
jgi:dTDP-4-dehydrorhamnose 3,5-epimerase